MRNSQRDGKAKPLKTLWKILKNTLLIGSGGTILLYLALLSTRPPQTNTQRSLFPGAIYSRQVRSQPRPLMIHIVEIDLTQPGLGVLVTPGETGADNLELTAQTPAEFLQRHNLQLAINANFFFPFKANAPWDYYPHSGDRVNVVGQAISNGSQYSAPELDWGVICFTAQLQRIQAQIIANGTCPPGTEQAVAGSAVIVADGKPVMLPPEAVDNDQPYSRSIVGLNRRKDRLWIIAIDDKQPFYSEGISLAELSSFLGSLGIDSALNLDGGGSTTLVAKSSQGAQILNAPLQTQVPMKSRPVANHLGFFWKR